MRHAALALKLALLVFVVGLIALLPRFASEFRLSQFTFVAAVLDCAAVRENNPNGHSQRTASVVRVRPTVNRVRFMDVSLSFNDSSRWNYRRDSSRIIVGVVVETKD